MGDPWAAEPTYFTEPVPETFEFVASNQLKNIGEVAFVCLQLLVLIIVDDISVARLVKILSREFPKETSKI